MEVPGDDSITATTIVDQGHSEAGHLEAARHLSVDTLAAENSDAVHRDVADLTNEAAVAIGRSQLTISDSMAESAEQFRRG